ncbi:TetR family transcriptional regulator [Mycobacterium bohemicum DSM 44277]|uniref:TetR family transcriptional regulator n=2 Tax=Mycobacterium bohemicum TaxID=56425 RepID=A0A1X1RAU2_MYCBE|nr:TetR/AcrR family transcriptional regulator [Mycobacterium bohemicum]MCV6968547.1 TetR/AcrR family transcriptional regulator [Mycobacterium bohemicum]ORV02248.1 TetR family transcriptional regulator [Mycobacterium bohemicum]CPR12897.1 TetR family transcriptional regulator [Mycobacterium bohemicum DSM 44277]
MSPAQLGRPIGASGEETRRRLVVATMRCVAQSGYSRATIREIARTAEVTSASLYNYFPNKSELMKAAIAARTDVALPRLRAAAARPGDVVDRIEAVLDESGQLMREYPDLAAFEWAIRSENAAAIGTGLAGGNFQAFREIIEGILADAGGDLPAGGAVEAIYSLVYGLTELAATLPPADYQAALGSAKQLVRGTLFARAGGPPGP